jgi:hypothetical protein
MMTAPAHRPRRRSGHGAESPTLARLAAAREQLDAEIVERRRREDEQLTEYAAATDAVTEAEAATRRCARRPRTPGHPSAGGGGAGAGDARSAAGRGPGGAACGPHGRRTGHAGQPSAPAGTHPSAHAPGAARGRGRLPDTPARTGAWAADRAPAYPVRGRPLAVGGRRSRRRRAGRFARDSARCRRLGVGDDVGAAGGRPCTRLLNSGVRR